MTVCMVNTFHYRRGGDSAYALGLEQGLRERGIDVANFAMHHPDSLPSDESAWFADHLDYPAMKAQGGLGNAVRVVQNSIYNRQARSKLTEFLDARPCSGAHAHSVMHHLTASVMLEFYERSVPVVWTLHDLKSVCPTSLYLREGQICEECSGGRFYNALRHRCKRGSLAASAIVTAELYLHRFWKVYEKADLLITPSRFLRDKLLESGLRPRRIEVLPNHVATDAIPAGTGPGDYVLYVGRVSREKGVSTLVEACRRAGVRLRVAGTGELLESLEQEAAGDAMVSFEGHVTGSALEDLYRGAALVAIPSECQENCPLVALEAFAWSRPVLGSNLGGLIELLADQGVGELVPAGDVDAWSDALARWMADPDGRVRSGRRARERAETDFAPERHMGQILAWYEELGMVPSSGAVGQ